MVYYTVEPNQRRDMGIFTISLRFTTGSTYNTRQGRNQGRRSSCIDFTSVGYEGVMLSKLPRLMNFYY